MEAELHVAAVAVRRADRILLWSSRVVAVAALIGAAGLFVPMVIDGDTAGRVGSTLRVTAVVALLLEAAIVTFVLWKRVRPLSAPALWRSAAIASATFALTSALLIFAASSESGYPATVSRVIAAVFAAGMGIMFLLLTHSRRNRR